MPLVSVIVPNYNHAPYLRQRLDSIFNQTFQDFEVIILDDCSTDNSKEIIEEYRNRPQVSHVVYNETNSGSPFKQWAKGFDLATGEYIWIAESDDWAEQEFLKEQVSVLEKDSSLILTFCESYWEYPQKTELSKIYSKDKVFRGIDYLQKRQIFRNSIVNASSVLFRKKFLTDVPTEYQDYSGSGDYLLWSMLCELGNIYYSSKILNHFRRHDFATTSKCISTGKTFFENFKIFKYFDKKGYINQLNKFRIIDYTINQIETNRTNLKKNGSYIKCKELWNSENNAKGLFAKIIYFWAKQLNKYNGLPLIAKIWKFFHLPNTNIRKRLFKWN
ncbi:MAG: glycosyltransferase family 2 protein [Hallerella succinigenes]|uniref:glycosyltransferase family 2 protein n=1 Tax=Hallerella succinigenes TaxID=1896222 RepID=UPI0023F1BF55|nr:glycosyltransferase family 2 protein [Hallerella succinigenes]MDD6090896.1 glycosyltransferase family 2 protein [Hallerella succinigenes]